MSELPAPLLFCPGAIIQYEKGDVTVSTDVIRKQWIWWPRQLLSDLTGESCIQWGHPGQRDDSYLRQDSTNFHHTTQNSSQFKTYMSFISGSFHLIFSDRSWPQVMETAQSGTIAEWGILHLGKLSVVVAANISCVSLSASSPSGIFIMCVPPSAVIPRFLDTLFRFCNLCALCYSALQVSVYWDNL